MGKSEASRRRRTLWTLVSALLVIHAVCWLGTRRLQQSRSSAVAAGEDHGLSRRALVDYADDAYRTAKKKKKDEADPDAEEVSESFIPYLELYEHITTRGGRVGAFIGMLAWMAFLFAFVGIVASDFFCPNLSTIASTLGLSESVAGVTFLGLGNGSPDVFSTFAAMRAGVGPLAIGELLGAAAFITSVVAGSMTLIRPFRVPRHSFLRDVGFFTLAVLFTLGILWDGEILAWEAAAMVALYVCYVIVVAVGTWWMTRRRKIRERVRIARGEYAAEGEEPQYRDDPDFPSQPGLSPVLSLGPPASDTSNLLHSPHLAPVDFPARSNSGPPTPIEEIADEAALHDIAQGRTHRHRSSILPGGRVRQPSVSIARAVPPASTSSGAVSLAPPTSPLLNPSRQRRTVAAVSPTHGHHSIRPSLLGAIEFRDVVNSLANQAAAQGTRPTSMLFGSSTSSLARPKHARASSFSHSGRASSSGFDADSRADDDLPSSRRARLTPGDATKRAVSSEAGAWGRSRGHRPAQSAVVQSSRPPWDWEQDESPVEEREEAEWPVVERRRRSEGDPGAPGPMVWDPPLEQDEEEDGERVDPWRDATPTRANLKLQIPLSRSRSRPPSAGAAAGAVPAIVLTGAAGDLSPIPPSPGRVDSGVNPLFAPSKARKGWIYFKTALSVLFPSLQGWSVKSWLGRFVALISAPAILLLNLTLPVVDADDCESESDGEEKDDGAHENDDDGEGGSGRRPEEDDADLSPESLKLRHERRDHHIAHALHSPAEFPHHDRRSVHSRTPPFASSPIDDADAAVPPLALPASHLESVWEGPSDGQITRALASVQCLLAPLFCLLALFGDDLRWWHFPIVLSLGLVLGAATYLFLADPRHPGRLGLCFVGFFVAMVWILTIVNEVVGVLQCIGHVCGLSDAILGLTIFAMGNSLGDLVANVTVARMGFPVMAMSACFGGPMLNVLLGIGLSSSYMIARSGKPYRLAFSPTLLVSGLGLLVVLVATLVIVPLNGFLMSRRLGAFLILAYCCVLAVNVVVEVKTTSRHHSDLW